MSTTSDLSFLESVNASFNLAAEAFGFTQRIGSSNSYLQRRVRNEIRGRTSWRLRDFHWLESNPQ